MAELKTWRQVPRAGVVEPEHAERPLTGDWRTNGRPVVSLEHCVNCLLCWLYCPDSAVVLDGTTLTGIDYDVCKGCELCVVVCPTHALAMAAEEA
jgi:2-oxoacid:acceptor oxidoreductase delta subunit (pyruvate/2-ketoisovalerate family)